MRARSLPPTWPLALVATVSLGPALLGCGPGFGLRGQAATPIGAAAPGPGASVTTGTSAGLPARPGDTRAERSSRLGSPAPADANGRAHPGDGLLDSAAHDHDDLPVLPPAASADDDDPEPVGLRDGAPRTAPQASKYASLDRSTCEAELGKRKIAFDRVGEARGVIAPLRLRGPIAGVDFHSMLPVAQRRTSPYEIYDCRLVLALDDWARVLARYDVVEVVHYSVYRPPPQKQVQNGPGRRHSGALAIDAALFKTRGGQTISVEKDFHGRIGSKPCGKNAAPTTGLPTEAVTLRNIVCEAADAQLFNVMLTPDFNWPHRNHFHLEVSAGSRWVYIR